MAAKKRKKKSGSSKGMLFPAGLVLAIAGFGGALYAGQYFKDHPLDSVGVSLARMFQAGQELPFEARVLAFFDSYGIMIGLAGLFLILAGRLSGR